MNVDSVGVVVLFLLLFFLINRNSETVISLILHSSEETRRWSQNTGSRENEKRVIRRRGSHDERKHCAYAFPGVWLWCRVSSPAVVRYGDTMSIMRRMMQWWSWWWEWVTGKRTGSEVTAKQSAQRDCSSQSVSMNSHITIRLPLSCQRLSGQTVAMMIMRWAMSAIPCSRSGAMRDMLLLEKSLDGKMWITKDVCRQTRHRQSDCMTRHEREHLPPAVQILTS